MLEVSIITATSSGDSAKLPIGARMPGKHGSWRGHLLAGIVLAVASWQVSAFDLDGYWIRATTDRAAGIEEGRQVLREGLLANAPASERTLLWHMGRAAIGAADEVALDEAIAHLERHAQARQDEVAASYVGFLRGARLLDTGDTYAGLVMVLESANRIAMHTDASARIRAAGELCRAYVIVNLADRAREHCQRHTRLLQGTGNGAELALAEHMEASVLSRNGESEAAIVRWRSARKGFRAQGLDALAARTAGALAADLVAVKRYDEALDMAAEALAAAEAVDSAIGIAIARGVMAEALLGLGRLSEAREQVEQGIALAGTLRHTMLIDSLMNKKAAIVLASDGDRTLDLQMQAREQEVQDALHEAAGQPEIATLEMLFRDREQQLRILELEHERRAQELALARAQMDADHKTLVLSQQRTLVWLAVAFSLLLLAGLAILARLLRAQRHLAQALRTQTHRDALTGIPNRRALLEAGKALLATPDAARRGHALMVLDVDHFKTINDRYGHPFGDTVLARIAECLQAAAAPQDLVARLGGEEFVLLCPNRYEARAGALADQVRREVAELALEEKGERVPVTISVGCAMFDAEVGDFSAWLQAADAALYRAKHGGRNRVEFAADHRPDPPQ